MPDQIHRPTPKLQNFFISSSLTKFIMPDIDDKENSDDKLMHMFSLYKLHNRSSRSIYRSFYLNTNINICSIELKCDDKITKI